MSAAPHRQAVTAAATPSFPAMIDMDSLDGTDGFRIDGLAQGDQAGHAVAAGDFNGDGYTDLIIGAMNVDRPGRQDAGAAYVVFGHGGDFPSSISPASLGGRSGFRIDGVSAGDQVGFNVASAGDINHDGFDDMVVSSYGANHYAGDAYVVFGKAGGFGLTLKLSTLDGKNGFHLTGQTGFSLTGHSATGAGDVNGDGIDDLIVSAAGARSAYVIYGKASGYSATLDLTALNGADGFRIDGLAGESSSPQTVASAGDVNGDGLDDLIIGAGAVGPAGRTQAGLSYVVFGRAGGFPAVLDVGALAPGQGFVIAGAAANDRSGEAVSSAGDLNGDGYADLVIGAQGHDSATGVQDVGAVYVVFGRGGGFPSVLNLAALNGHNGFRIEGGPANNYVGYSAAAAGDVNGDGFGDLILSAWNTNANYIVFGKAGGFDASLDLSTIDGSNGVQLSMYGAFSVAPAGDVNGDGLADVVLGNIEGAPDQPSFAGMTSVLFGRLPDGPVTRVGSAIGQTIWGGTFDDTLNGRAGNDTLIGGGGRDQLIGGTGADTFVFKALSDSTSAAPDRIADLTDADTVDLSAIDANANAFGNQAFHLVAGFTHHVGEASLSYDAAHNRTTLQLDVNADAVADMTIQITGDHHGFINFVL